MRQLVILIVSLKLYSFILLGCAQIESVAPDPDSTATPEVTASPTPAEVMGEVVVINQNGEAFVTVLPPRPTPTPKGEASTALSPAAQAAVDTALAYFGDKATNLKVTLVAPPSITPGYLVRLQQTYQGIPIHNARFRVTVDSGEILDMSGTYYEDIDLEITPTLSLSQAVEIAVARREKEKYIVESWSGLLIDVYSEKRETKYKLVWNIGLEPPLCPLVYWTVWVDAHTGEVLYQYFHPGGGKLPRTEDCITYAVEPAPTLIHP